MPHDLSILDVVLRLGLAVLFGAVVGWEREKKDRPAGLRTNTLVALGSAGFTLVAIAMIQEYLQRPGDPLPIDPAKIIAGIVGGIGFLGAGAILHGEKRVRGLTTAAGIWVVASVGVASGAGYFAIAGVCVGFAVFILTVLHGLELRHKASPKTEEDDA
ncbi:MAG: MgtC/SapB family protein [Phycisphaeraceae bacterium]